MTAMKRWFQHYIQLIFFKNGERTFYHITAECEVLKKNSVFFVQSLTTADLYVRHIALILGVSIYSFICILPSV